MAKQAECLPLTEDGVFGSLFETKLKDRKEKHREMKYRVLGIEQNKYPALRKSSNYPYENKQRRYNDNFKNFNSRSYSMDHRSPFSSFTVATTTAEMAITTGLQGCRRSLW